MPRISTVEAGSLGEREARKTARVIDLSMQNGVPLIGLNDSGGARVSEGLRNFAFWNIFQRNVMASGVIPQIFAILGPCAGGAVYSPALGDFIFMVKDISAMFLTGPAVVKAVTGEEVTKEKLGGPPVQTQISGVAHFLAATEKECMEMIRELLSYLPSNNRQKPPHVETGDDPLREDESLRDLVPEDPRKSYDMRQVVKRMVDDGNFFEVQRGFAGNMLIGFARLDGDSVGIVANQPRVFAGCLDIHASDKAARFIRFCDAFNIPLITLVDVPGYMPGLEQEYGGIIRHGAKMLYAYAEATVPKITVLLRKAYGGANLRHVRQQRERSGRDSGLALSGGCRPGGRRGGGDLFLRRIEDRSRPRKAAAGTHRRVSRTGDQRLRGRGVRAGSIRSSTPRRPGRP